MIIPYESRKVFIAGSPIDFRMSIDSLSQLIMNENNTHIYDGSIYVFYNKHRNRIKCLFWDKNGFVLYYKRLESCTFKIKNMLNTINQITASDLEQLLSGFEPRPPERKSIFLERLG